MVTKDKEVIIPLKDIEVCTRDTCRICEDASSQLADISAGSAGSLDGWTTLIIRTEIGEELVRAVASEGVIETMKLGSEAIKELEQFAINKKTRNYGLMVDQMEVCSACLTNPYP